MFLDLVVDQSKMAQLLTEQGIQSAPAVRIIHHGNPAGEGAVTYGQYFPIQKTIYMYLDQKGRLETQQLRFANTQALETFLHEFRHHWQYENWTDEQWARSDKQPYATRDCEIDARQWAAANITSQRGLVRLTRRHHGGGMSILSRNERKVGR